MKKLWILLIAVVVFSFTILGWVGTEIFRQAPPIPREVVTSDGKVLIPAEQIGDGQNVWQAITRCLKVFITLMNSIRAAIIICPLV